jgi:hypothetical protein
MSTSPDRPPFELVDYDAADWSAHTCAQCSETLRPACGFYSSRLEWEAEHGPLTDYDATAATPLPAFPGTWSKRRCDIAKPRLPTGRKTRPQVGRSQMPWVSRPMTTLWADGVLEQRACGCR